MDKKNNLKWTVFESHVVIVSQMSLAQQPTSATNDHLGDCYRSGRSVNLTPKKSASWWERPPMHQLRTKKTKNLS